MFKYIKLISLFIFTIFLAGCSEIRFETDILVSELKNSKELKKSATIFIEVDSCENRHDAYKDSGTIRAVKKMMDDIFIDSKFSHCEDIKFTSMAAFNIPIYINDGYMGNTFIKINSDENGFLSIFVPQAISNNVESMVNSSFDPKSQNISFNISLINDTTETITVTSLASFINEEPSILQQLELPERNTTSISLSNVSLSDIIKNEKSVILK